MWGLPLPVLAMLVVQACRKRRVEGIRRPEDSAALWKEWKKRMADRKK